MAYRYEKNPITGESELVIDGWERGIADSPYGGLASIKNFNISYLPGAVYPNYKRLPASTSGGTGTFTTYTTNDSSITVYPQASGAGSNTTCDGWIKSSYGNSYLSLSTFRTEVPLGTTLDSYIGYSYDYTCSASSYIGQQFTVSGNSLLTGAIFIIKASGSLTGNIYAKLYASLQSDAGVPTGTALATSDAVDASTLSSSSYANKVFTFSTTSQVNIIPGRYYVIVLYNASSGSIYAKSGTTDSYAGGCTSSDGTTWSSISYDIDFYVRGVRGGYSDQSSYLTTLYSASSLYYDIGRSFFSFDTSSIPDTATITSAVFSFVATSKINTFSSNPAIHLASSTQTNANTLYPEDFIAIGSTSFGSIEYSDIVADSTTYNNISLNATGLSAISKTGVTKFSIQSSWDITSTGPGVSSTLKYMLIQTNFADKTTFVPQLLVNYTTLTGNNTIVVSGITTNKGYDAFTVSNTGGGLPTGLSANTVYYNLNTLNTISNTFQVSATKGGSAITISSAGTGTQNIVLIRPGYPIGWTYDPNTGKYFILCYDSASAVKIQVWEFNGTTNYWTLLSGNGQTKNGTDPTDGTHLGIAVWKKYLFVFHDDRVDVCGNGTTITQASWSNSWQTGLTMSASPVSTLWGTIDFLYFANGYKVGSLQENSGKTFAPGDATTYTWNTSALTLPSYDTISYMTELKTNLVIASGNKLYFWDQISTSFTYPLFIKEPIFKVINIRNMLYIFAGYKGNIYTSNGYAIDFFKKIPDSFAGTSIDPQWKWGDVMSKHNKLYFGASVINPTPGGVMGIFSINLSGGSVISALGVTDGALNYENQNYCGSNVASGTLENTLCLINIDDNPYNNFLSAWYSNGYGGMDFNDNTLYNNNEATIETDLIPVGTFLTPHTPQNIEFKLDTPLLTGDSISIYARSSLGETYKFVGTTSTEVLSANLGSLGLENMQWLQIKLIVSCGSPSSFIRLREIRVR